MEHEVNLSVIFSDKYLTSPSYDAFTEIAKAPGLVQHCTIMGHSDWNSLRPDLLKCLRTVSSIDLKHHVTTPIQFPTEEAPFHATALSFESDWHHLEFINWAIKFFPNLQHLYINSLFNGKVLPLKSNVFPNLTHFYSKSKQSSAFWGTITLNCTQALICLHRYPQKGHSKGDALNPS
ncbi:hypothetical protein DSO57_1036345 [Entomophthora muscae]|uniref:Uncharacterized protein n=1 Tax=Entomophthora muscae TaxID=34485 RepID=A0ACC2SZG6_9FUNG|nr:hypothetical protein DSO57_1036345 [Entomophthora muscae]